VIVLFLLGLVVAPAALADGPLLRLVKTADAMGSTYSVELYGYDRAKLTEAADAALEEARRLDDLLSNYKPEANGAGSTSTPLTAPCGFRPKCSACCARVWNTAAKARAHSIFPVGPLMKVWGFYKGTGPICRTMPKWRRPWLRWVTGTCISTPPPRPSGSTGPAWRWTPAASAKAMPWTGWWMF